MDASQIAPSKPQAPAQPAIDYGAFSASHPTLRLYALPGIIGVIALVVLLGVAITQVAHSHQTFTMNSDLPHGGLIMLAMALIFVSFWSYTWRRSKYLGEAFRQFLAANQWAEITDPSNDDVATSMLGIGNSQKIHDAFSGTYKGMPFRAVRYEYTTGSGKSSHTYYFVDLHFDLKRAFPLIVLDNKESAYFKFIDDLPRIPGSHPLQLEGNFNDTYKVSVMPGTERDVLQVLTPDFMSELMNSSLKIDAELEANKLYIIKHGSTNWKAADLQELFSMADVITKNLGELAGTWQASSSASTVADIAGTALAPRERAVLRPHHIIGAGTVIVLAIYLLGLLFGYKFHI